MEVRNRVLTASLGLAPAVIGAASNPSGGEAALVGALIAALGGAASLLLRDGSRTVVTGLTIDRLERGPAQGETSRTMLTVDYTVELSVNVGGPSFPLRVSTRDGKPMKLRYRGVGVEVDTAAADWWNGIGLVTTRDLGTCTYRNCAIARTTTRRKRNPCVTRNRPDLPRTQP